MLLFLVHIYQINSWIVLGDGSHRSTGYVMAHQLFKLYPLPGVESVMVSVWRQIWEGIQVEQLMSHYITRTAVTTVAKYDLAFYELINVWYTCICIVCAACFWYRKAISYQRRLMKPVCEIKNFTKILVVFIVRRLVLETHKCVVKYTEFIYWVMQLGDIAFPGIRMVK